MTPNLYEWVDDLYAKTDAIGVIDESLRIRRWNDAMSSLSGLSASSVMGVSLHDLFPKLWGSDSDRALLSAIRTGEHAKVDQPFFAASTPVVAKDTEWFVAPLLSGGRIRGCLVIARSRGRRIDIERDISEVEQRFRAIADSSPVLLWMSGTDSLCTFFNQTWLAFSGRSMEEELGVGWTEGVHPEDFQTCMNTYMRSFSAREAFEMEYRLRRHDGEYRWMLDHGSPRYAADGTFMGYCGSCVDITDRRLAEQRTILLAKDLERATSQMEELLYAASHDLHEPIRMVTNFLELLRQRTGDQLDETSVKYLEFAREGGVRMGSLVESLLAFSRTRTGSGGRSPKIESVESRRIVLDALNDLHGVIEEAKAEVNIADDLPTVKVDPALLRSLLFNLLGNAVKFRGDEPPRIRVTAQRRSNEWVFSIEDNGIGFAPEDATRVFEMFRRLHPRSELGLALAREIVKRHGGEIWVRSDVGQGATFSFSLPD